MPQDGAVLKGDWRNAIVSITDEDEDEENEEESGSRPLVPEPS
jgi:hypothetical protein